MELKPLHDRIVVRERRPSTVSAGGIFIGQAVDDGLVKELVEGEVLSVGPGLKTAAARRDSMWDIVPGMIVKYSPVCSYGVGDVVMIRRDAIAGVLREEE